MADETYLSLPPVCFTISFCHNPFARQKGVGLAIVRQLALQYSKSPLNNGPLLVYLTARDKSRGEKALEELQSDKQLLSAKALAKDGGLTSIKYAALDISDKKSIEEFAALLKKEHGQIDIIVNNAGVAMDGFSKLVSPPHGC